MVILGYNYGMKTAISIPDTVFRSAESLAHRLGVSRSALYAQAVAEYVAKHRDAKVTERLNAIYGAQPRRSDAAVRRVAQRTFNRSDW